MKYTLNELFTLFKDNNITRCELEGYIYLYFFDNQDKTSLHHWERDEYEDYVSWFHPRLKKAVDTYRETGSTFEMFMKKFIHISSKEYRVRTTTQNITEYSTWCARIPELYLREEAPEYHFEKDENTFTNLINEKYGKRNKRCILALLLKCYYYVSENFIDRIADMIGMDEKQLREMINEMRKIRQKRDDQIYHMKERIYCQFYRCIVYEKRMQHMQQNSTAYNKLKLRHEKAKMRLDRMRKRLTLLRTDATNKQVAQVIGIQKGTVDSSLHRLRVKMNLLAQKAPLN